MAMMGSGGGSGELSGLIDVIRNPEKYDERMQQLERRELAAKDAERDAAEAKHGIAEREAEVARREEDVEAREAALEGTLSQLKLDQKELKDGLEALLADQSTLDQRTANFIANSTQKTEDLQAWEERLDRQARQVAADMASAEALRGEYEEKTQRLRAAMGEAAA